MGGTHDRMQGVKLQGMEGFDNSFKYILFVCMFVSFGLVLHIMVNYLRSKSVFIPQTYTF